MTNGQPLDNEQRVIWLTSCSHFLTHGYMTLFSAVMVVVAGENSMSFMDLGMIANVGYFLYGLGGIPAGYLADRYGPKRILTIGVLGMSFASLLVGLSLGMWSFAVAYALLGLFSSIHHAAGLSFIARRVASRKGKAMGIHGVLGNVGLVFTPMAGAGCIWLFQTWRAAYLVYGLVGLLFACVVHRTKVEGEHDLALFDLLRGRQGWTPVAATPGQESGGSGPREAYGYMPLALLFLFLGSTISGFIFRGSLTFFPALFRQEIRFIVNHDQPVVMAGYLTTAVLSFGLIGAWFGGYVNDKIKRPELYPAAVFILVAPLFYLISKYSDNKLIMVSALFSLIYYTWQPCQNYLIAKYTKKAFHGVGFGINFFLLFGVGSIATSIGGYVTDELGVDRFYGLMAWVSMAALLASLLVYAAKGYEIRYWGRRAGAWLRAEAKA